MAAPVTVVPFPTPAQRPVSNRRATRSPQFPVWLRLLLGMQQGSTAIAFCLAALALAIYASTVYLQQQWSAEYDRLQTLQREQRSLMAVDAMVENQLARQAQQPESGLVAPSPTNTIFLPKATEPPTTRPVAVAVNQQSLAQRPPLGY
ncbi:MAG: hypothetical protein HC910_16950 [Spirulinaceae cyanobacterium SM2_1_0]|nr:hypothetical protein [Spirulinaceae cyanobacterium SM2_1_0]